MMGTYGLEWQTRFLMPEPRWSVEPDVGAIEILARYHLGVPTDVDLKVSFMTKGSLNKVYRIEYKSAIFIFRVALPVDPIKVAGEVATMRWLKENPLRSVWRGMDMSMKESVVIQLARFNIQLFERRFDTIGCMQERFPAGSSDSYASEEGQALAFLIVPFLLSAYVGVSLIRYILRRPVAPAATIEIGRITSFRHHLEHPRQVDRPCRNSYAWLVMRLQDLILQTQRDREVADEDEMHDFDRRHTAAEHSKAFLPRMFPPDALDSTTLFHHDLHKDNILVDTAGKITAILDWEFQYTVPTWYSARFPKLLMTLRRHNPPAKEKYDVAESHLSLDEYEACQGISICYWWAMEEYESTLLRAVYMEHMTKNCPEWVHEYRAGRDRRLLMEELAVLEGGLMANTETWLAGFDEKGKCTQKSSTWKCEEERLCHTEEFDENTDDEEDYDDTSDDGECDGCEEEQEDAESVNEA